MIWLFALALTVFAILYLAGLWQYACDEIGTAIERAMREIGQFFK